MDGINWSIYPVERQVQQELILKVKKREKAELKLKLFTLKKGKQVTCYNFFDLLTFHIHHSADIISLKLCMFDVDSLHYSNSRVKSFQPPLTGHWHTLTYVLMEDCFSVSNALLVSRSLHPCLQGIDEFHTFIPNTWTPERWILCMGKLRPKAGGRLAFELPLIEGLPFEVLSENSFFLFCVFNPWCNTDTRTI